MHLSDPVKISWVISQLEDIKSRYGDLEVEIFKLDSVQYSVMELEWDPVQFSIEEKENKKEVLRLVDIDYIETFVDFDGE